MARFERLPRLAWRFIRLPPRLIYSVGLGSLIGRTVLLLTTTGRRTGRRRTTPLQYEEIDGSFYVAAARGPTTDWLRNLLSDRHVELRVGSRRFKGTARVLSDPEQIADFLELRVRRRPRLMPLILRAGGMPADPTREDFVAYARQRPLAIITPDTRAS